MKRYYTVFLIVLFQQMSNYSHPPKTNHRNLIILLDQSGSHENVTNNYVSLTHELLAALQSECCPVLVSSFIWKNILEKKREAAFSKTNKTAPEQSTLGLFEALNTRISQLDTWHKQTTHDKHIRAQAIVAQINNDFYSDAALQKLKKNNLVPQWAYSDYVVMDHFRFNQHAWDIYWVNERLLLFVPKMLAHKSLGLKIDALERCQDPGDLSALYLQSFAKTNEPVLKSLKKIMVSKQEQMQREEQPFAWTIILDGHGRNYHEAPRSAGRVRYIADLSLSDFKELLNFFEKEIIIHLLVSGSCQSSGLLWQKMSKTEKVSYSYPILLTCLTDVTSYGYVIKPKLPFFTDQLSVHDIAYDKKNDTFRFAIDYLYRYKDFFTAVTNLCRFDTHECEQLKSILPSIIEPHINNTPVFLTANQKLLLYNPTTTVYITDISPAVCSTSLYGKETVLLDIPHIAQALQFTAQNMPRFVSVTAGTAYHRMSSIIMDNGTLDTFAQAFWPLHGLSVDKFFLIDELRCLAGENYAIFNNPAEQLSLKNVLVHIQKDQYMRLCFEYNNQVFSGHARLIDKKPTIRDMHIIRTIAPRRYSDLYTSLAQKKVRSKAILAQGSFRRLHRLT